MDYINGHHCSLPSAGFGQKGEEGKFYIFTSKAAFLGVTSGWLHYSTKGRCSSPPGGPPCRLFFSQVLEMDPTFFLSCIPDTT